MGFPVDSERLDEVIKYIRNDCTGEPSIVDVLVLAELMVGSTKSFFTALDSAIYREFRELAEYIANAKQEIGNLQVNEMHQMRLPDAGKQLDAIVKSTEEATNRIMEQAEAIMAADASDQEAYQAVVNGAVMEIFEACSFQDITGQRISKVVETLQYIEKRVSHFANAIHTADAVGPMDDEERALEERKREQLLHGPDVDGNAVSQDAVDQLLADGAAIDIDAVTLPGEAQAAGDPAPAKAAAETETEKQPAPAPMPAAEAKEQPAPAPQPAAPPPAAAAKPAPKPAAAPVPKPAAATPEAPPAAPAAAEGETADQSSIDALFD